MISRYIYIICLVLSLLTLSIRAEDQTSDEYVDPALEAVQALTTEEPEAAMEPAMTEELTDMEAGIESGTEMEPVTDTVTDDQVVVTFDQEPEIPVKDVVLVLDNSGSMKKNDPQFLVSQAVNEFISQLDNTTRLAIIIFDQSVKIAIPLTLIDDDSRSTILGSLVQINYSGKYTDSPAAIERAIYDLKTNGRVNAKKLIVFMTDGIVDTGNSDQDLEKARWLKQDLAADAADEGIQIFGIAFTENADFQLIQSLAQQTDGEYYRALQPEDLKNVFERIHTIINRVPEPEPEPVVAPPPAPVELPPQPREVAPPPPVIIEVPVQSQKMDEEEELRSKMILVALAVLIIAVIIMVLMLIRGSRTKGDDDEYVQEAFLNDINNYTPQSSYKLGKKPSMLGRVAGTDTEHLNYIVIPETTIGRRHALIEYKDFAYWIIDQGSINGTFVNDQMITSETRLKHGDRIRLHKFEFEFLMPEMADAGMTVISKTVLATNPALATEEETIARGSSIDTEGSSMPEPDFDLTGGMDSGGIHDPDEEDTVIREPVSGADAEHDKDEDEDESSDETLMLDDDTAVSDEDATIRPDMVKDDD
jgi:Mg-chelatase subunit ChlD